MLARKIVTSKLVYLAVKRHVDDLEHAAERGFYFDESAAQRPIDFIQTFCCHSKGEWAGQPFKLSPWQQFIIWVLFGWKRSSDGLRRFREAFIEIARKNGKSTLIAAILLFLLFGDNEPGAEIYTAATKRDQAKIIFSESQRMVRKSQWLLRNAKILTGSIIVRNTNSIYQPLGADEDTLDGLNPAAVGIDELHAHKTRGVYDVMDTGTGARRQPLLISVTTAGGDKQGICWEVFDYASKVLNRIIDDDTFFAFVAELDDGDDWQDSKLWVKANPNLGISAKKDDLQRKYKKALENPAAAANFKRKHLNIWECSDVRWMDLDRWDACAGEVDEETLVGMPCYSGLDLAVRTDLAALVHVFPIEDRFKVLCRFFIPDAAIRQKTKIDRFPYDTFIRQGVIYATPGEVIDYRFILDVIDRDAQKFDIQEIAYDKFGAVQLVQMLSDAGLNVIDFHQGIISMSPPTKATYELVLERKLEHGGNPVLRWNISNVVCRMDSSGNLKPDKQKSTNKIDGAVALIMAVDRALHKTDQRSVYENETTQM